MSGPLAVRREVTARWPLRLPGRSAPDGVLRVRGGVVERLLQVEGEPVVVRAGQRDARRLVLEGRADRPELAEEGIARMAAALGADDDLAPFHERFRHDPLIGAAVRADPALRPFRRPDPWEALAWAITEQLIEYVRAAAIQRRMVRTLGPRCERTGLRGVPSAERVAALAPARLCSYDLTETRAIAMVRAAREVAAGRVDLHGDHEAGWRRLERIRGIGRWTTEILAVHGQGRFDVLPAGDLGFLKLVGRLQTGRPKAVAPEEDVRALFAPYGEWQGLAAAYALRLGPERLARATGARTATRPDRRGTRWSPRPPLPELA